MTKWCIDKYRIERYENDEGKIVEDRDLVERLVFDNPSDATVYYRNNRISYGSGAVYYMLDPIYESNEQK